MKFLINAYVNKYNLIELVYGVDTLLNEKERMWKNPNPYYNAWYSETEIKSYIEDMDKIEIKELMENA
jgi:hypothetical protein